MKKYFIILITFLICYQSKSQENTIHNDILYHYKTALKYYKLEEYSNAYSYFQKVILQKSSTFNSEVECYKSEAKFYNSILEVKFGTPDADKNIISFYNSIVDKEKKEVLAYHLGNYYFEKGDFINTSEWFKDINGNWMQVKEKDNFLFRNAYALMKNGKNEAAIIAFESSISFPQSSNYEMANYYCGMMLYNSKKYDESEKYLSKIQTSNNSKLDIPFVLGQINFLKNRFQEVIQLNENRINESSPNYKDQLQLLGKSYFKINRFDKAQLFLEKYVMASDKVSAEDMYMLAYSEYKNKNYREAISHFKELQLSVQEFSPYAMYALADCYLKTDEKNNARLAFISASKFESDSLIKEESFFNIAKLNYELNNYNDAISGFNSFIINYPNSKHIKETWTLLAKALLAANNYPQAIALIEKNSNLQDGNEKLYQEICYVYALNLYKNEEYDSARRYVRKAMGNPFDKGLDAESNYLYSEILFQERKYNESLSAFTNTLKIIQKENVMYNTNANLFNTYYGLGYSEYMLKNNTNALKNFKLSLKFQDLKLSKSNLEMINDMELRCADIYFLERSYDSAYLIYSKIAKGKEKSFDYALFQKASIEGVKKNFSEKIQTLKNLIQEIPKSIYIDDAQYQLGLAYEDLKNLDFAIREYTDLYKNKPKSVFAPKALIRIATIKYNNNKPNEAKEFYANVIENYSNAAEADQALTALKEIYIGEEKLDEFLAYVQKLPAGMQLSISSQDSMLFGAGEEYYANGNCEKAQNYFIKYLNNFPEGMFSKKAHFYRAECYLIAKQYDDAIDEYKSLTDKNDHPYFENATIKAAYIFFNFKKDYTNALVNYQKANEVLTTKNNRQLVKLGSLICNYELQNYNEVINDAKSIESDQEITDEFKMDAKFYSAKAHYFLKDKKLAMALFSDFLNDKNSERSAECAYYYAKIQADLDDYKKSNDFLFKAKEDYAMYEYWVVKYYILMAANYHKIGDNFQAKATIESIIQNYKGNKQLIEEAKKVQKEIEEAMKKKSKVNYNEK
jgi:TolA-binding protein